MGLVFWVTIVVMGLVFWVTIVVDSLDSLLADRAAVVGDACSMRMHTHCTLAHAMPTAVSAS